MSPCLRVGLGQRWRGVIKLGMKITDFLLKRIAEDEAVARAAIDPFVLIENNARQDWEEPDDGVWVAEGGGPCVNGESITIYDGGGHHRAHAQHIARWDPKRALAECVAKRAIVDLHDDDSGAWVVESQILLASLAAIYSDHPDYQQEWKWTAETVAT